MFLTSDAVALAQALVQRASVTPNDAGCQQLIADCLVSAGYQAEFLQCGEVANLWCSRTWGTGPVFVFLGHTDVVPTGPLDRWRYPPFDGVLADGVLHGRGSADMKASVAAMVCAMTSIASHAEALNGTLALLLTSDEEGDAIRGVREVVEIFRARGQRIDYCLVGEPSSARTLGDVVRIGRRGSLTGTVEVKGIQGHVAYPEKASNPIHAALPVLQLLQQTNWDGDTSYPDFPPTSFQIANFHAGTGASNVIPGTAQVQFNLRYSPRWSADALIEKIESAFRTAAVEASFQWHRSGEPFHTQSGVLREAVRSAIASQLGLTADENTGGGTSDGRFVATLGAEVVELGPINASIHQVDECVLVEDISRLHALYEAVARECLTRNRR